MPLTFSIDSETRIVRLNYFGDLSDDEWVGVMQAVLDDPRYEVGFSFLCDRRLAAPPTAHHMGEVLSFVRARETRFAGGHWAMVVTGPAALEMGRMVQSRAVPPWVLMELFQDVTAAEEWLRRGSRHQPVAVTHVERSLLRHLADAGGRETFRPEGSNQVARGIFDRDVVRILQSLQAKRLVRIDDVESRQIGTLGHEGRYAAIAAELTDAGREALQ